MTTLDTALEHWGHPSRETNTKRTTKDSGLSFSNHTVPSSQYLFVSDIWQPDEVGEKPTIPPTNTNLPEIMQHTRSPSNTSSMMPFAGGSLYLPQASFTATNADNIKTHDALNPETRNPTAMAPLQTYFNGDPVAYDSYDSYNSEAGFSADGSAYSAISTAPSQWSYTTDWEGPTDTQHCESDPNQDQSCESDPNDVQSASSATGRRRSVEKADPSSARAVYLEKNRQAASKCRSKQKRQQEDLVETAREKERKNKVLKAEVEFLTSDLHDLIELVGKHDTCVDSRLRRYIQVEADRLLARDGHSPVAELLLSNSSSSRGSASPENS